MAMRSIVLRSAPSRPRVSPRAPSRPAPRPAAGLRRARRVPARWLPRPPARPLAGSHAGCSASTASVPAGQSRLQRLHQPEPAAARRRSHCLASRAALPWLRPARRLAVPSGSAPDPPRAPRACVASPASLAPAPARPAFSASTRLRRVARAVSPCRPYAARPAADSGSPVPPAGLCLAGSSPSAGCRCAGRFPVSACVASPLHPECCFCPASCPAPPLRRAHGNDRLRPAWPSAPHAPAPPHHPLRLLWSPSPSSRRPTAPPGPRCSSSPPLGAPVAPCSDCRVPAGSCADCGWPDRLPLAPWPARRLAGRAALRRLRAPVTVRLRVAAGLPLPARRLIQPADAAPACRLLQPTGAAAARLPVGRLAAPRALPPNPTAAACYPEEKEEVGCPCEEKRKRSGRPTEKKKRECARPAAQSQRRKESGRLVVSSCSHGVGQRKKKPVRPLASSRLKKNRASNCSRGVGHKKKCPAGRRRKKRRQSSHRKIRPHCSAVGPNLGGYTQRVR
ncbi:hypothetical protein ACQJBY_015737 [Aegilops geniculata]